MSRFDILCVVRDECDPMEDQRLAQFVCHSHVRHHPRGAPSEVVPTVPQGGVTPVPQELLRKYLVSKLEF